MSTLQVTDLVSVDTGTKLKPDLLWSGVGRYFAPKNGDDVFTGIVSSILAVDNRAQVNGSAIDTKWSRLDGMGCHTSFGTTDCSLSCMDPGLLFGSLSSLTNCITLSAASLLLINNLTEEETGRLSLFGVLNIADFNASKVFDSVTQCALASCEQTGPRHCSSGLRSLETKTPDAGSLHLLRQEMRGYCNNTLLPFVSIAPDIAGPGVCQSFEFKTLRKASVKFSDIVLIRCPKSLGSVVTYRPDNFRCYFLCVDQRLQLLASRCCVSLQTLLGRRLEEDEPAPAKALPSDAKLRHPINSSRTSRIPGILHPRYPNCNYIHLSTTLRAQLHTLHHCFVN